MVPFLRSVCRGKNGKKEGCVGVKCFTADIVIGQEEKHFGITHTVHVNSSVSLRVKFVSPFRDGAI